MSKFEDYLRELASHEAEKSDSILQDPRTTILVHAGIRLNWLGDFFANPAIKWVEREVPIEQIQFTGTSPEWNEVLIIQCSRSVAQFCELINRESELKAKFEKEASFGEESILVRTSEDEGLWKVLDGMHRFVGAVLQGKDTVKVFLPLNENEHLPVCEAHVVYDLIRAFTRNARDDQGKNELYHALKLLARTYENVIYLLRNRFSENYVYDTEAQKVIQQVIKEAT